MKLFVAAVALASLVSTTAKAGDDIDEVCMSIGEFTAIVFEARHADAPIDDVKSDMLGEVDNEDLKEVLIAVIDGVYALDLEIDAEASDAQIVDFTAEMIGACEEG